MQIVYFICGSDVTLFYILLLFLLHAFFWGNLVAAGILPVSPSKKGWIDQQFEEQLKTPPL